MERKQVKQVVVMRVDLRNTKGEKIRTGKMIAQGAHASLKAILDLTTTLREKEPILYYNSSDIVIPIEEESALELWLEDKFTKVCVQVSSEAELLEIYQKAKDNNIICSLIQDAGLTEFGGVPTYTCCAIGPDFDEKINEITGHLKLL